MLTKKDFVVIADVLRVHRNRAENGQDCAGTYLIDKVMTDLASEFARLNPRFDRGKFFKAVCGEEEANDAL